VKKVIVTGDYHAQYLNLKAFNKMLKFTKQYKPDVFVINGDLVDAFSISKFEKNPKRKTTLYNEVIIVINILDKIRNCVGKKCKIYWTKGNHLDRLSRYLNTHSELLDFPFFDIETLFKLKKFNVVFVNALNDYDKNNKGLGHLILGDMLIMHGDGRLNGAKTSINSGASCLKTCKKFFTNVCMNHVHRLALVYHHSPYKNLVCMECGCLCDINGGMEWTQGFGTFEFSGKKSFNHRVIRVEDLK